MFINIINLTRWNVNRCYSLQTTNLLFEAFQILFSNSFIDFYGCKVVSSSDMRKFKAQRLAFIMAVEMKLWGCIPLGLSGSRSVIQDHSDHGTSKEPMNLWPEWIHWCLWCTMIWVILGHWSGSGSPQKNATWIYFIWVVAKCLHFVMSNKKRKQTLESVLYELEIIFNYSQINS